MTVEFRPPLQATVTLARRVDRAEIDFCALASAAGPRGAADSLDAGGGRALYAGPSSPLNKVLGLGLGHSVGDADLEAIEAFYRERQCPVQIELCPLAQPGLAPRLSARGYVLQGFENELGRRLEAPLEVPPIAPGVQVRPASAAEDDLWIDRVSRGFCVAEGATGEPDAEMLAALKPIMRGFTHPALTRYLAWIDGQVAGGGAAWVSDGVLGIAGTSTLVPYRGRGVQVALVAYALADGGGQADFATATTAPGSISQRNFERLGFQVLYTRAVFVLS